ncbi:reverse transcriptase domain-containing protein, partial [Tanacetum coccineum]
EVEEWLKSGIVKAEVEEWIKSRIVKRVQYPSWVANPILVKKADGSWRMLKNAGATYQRLVDTIFEGRIGRNLEAYVDDMVIKRKTEQNLIKDIEETLLALKKVNMKLNPKKCSFGMEEGKLLGYIVTSDGTWANPEKAKVLVSMPSVSNVK